MDLVRKIVFALEEHEHGRAPERIQIDGYSDEQIGYHVHLMSEAGLVRAAKLTHSGHTSPYAKALGLTWQGHELAESARDDTLWNKAKEHVKEKAGGVAFGVLVELLKAYGKQALGI